MTNFRNVLGKTSITIPIIQRDYAQGRKGDKVNEIRDTFLNTIFEKLEQNKTLHLDFVYGSIKENSFIPLDGQQRLTTLFLLHWYFTKKEKQDTEFLKLFTYETRASSREFCQKIVENEIDCSSSNFIKKIEDSDWFLAYWKNDPTIQSMLVMIDSIHQKFKNENFLNRLDNITFEFFELVKFGLDDDLYIKMNARGKPLTEFENFKAQFEQFLKDQDENLEREFAEKIDNEWTDFFWKYKDDKYLIDRAFMNYFYYITEMISYKMNKEFTRSKVTSFKSIEIIYQDIDNIKLLFKSLDKLKVIVKSFDILFSKSIYESSKIALFEKDINFLELVIKSGHIDRVVSIQKKFIVFMLINFLVDNEIDDTFKDFIRVVRNIIERIRNLKRNELTYTPNFEYKDLNKYLNLFLKYLNSNIYEELAKDNGDLSDKEFQHEKEKALLILSDNNFREPIYKLEDYKYLKGDIHNFITNDLDDLIQYSKNLPSIFNSTNDSKVIQAMLSCGEDAKLNKGSTRKVSARYFFGKNGYWEILLTAPNKKDFFTKFLNVYIQKNYNYESIISDFLQNYNKKDWRYYFVKYDEILNTNNNLSSDYNFFAWSNDFEIEKMGGKHLGAFHINPYIIIVSNRTQLSSLMAEKGDDNSYLYIEDEIEHMFSIENGWQIKFARKFGKEQREPLIKKFTLEETKSSSTYILSVDATKDRIEVAIDFINSL